jgi:DNA-directed RNA polymerase subunit RPC12/RpoP
MGIVKKYKIPVELHYHCDKCKTEVEFTGIVLTSNPAHYVHRCPNCNEEIWLDQSYPCIVYEDKTIANDMFAGNFNFLNKK